MFQNMLRKKKERIRAQLNLLKGMSLAMQPKEIIAIVEKQEEPRQIKKEIHVEEESFPIESKQKKTRTPRKRRKKS